MNGSEQFGSGPAEGSTFSTTLHLLSPRMQEWIRRTSDRQQLRRFACACARAAFALCPKLPREAKATIELAERSGDGTTSEEFDRAYAAMSPVIREAFDEQRLTHRGVECGQATLDDYLAAELAHRAAISARACVLRSAPVAAAETVFEYVSVMTRRKMHDVQTAFLRRADELLDSQRSWAMEQQAEPVQSYLRDLPRPFVVRLQKASDASLRRFACTCVAEALEAGRKEIAALGEVMDFEPLVRTIEVARRHADGRANSAELAKVFQDEEKRVRDWYQKADDLKYHSAATPAALRAAGIMAETAACVHCCAEASAKLAGVKSLRLAMPILSLIDSAALVQPLAEKFLGPPPPE